MSRDAERIKLLRERLTEANATIHKLEQSLQRQKLAAQVVIQDLERKITSLTTQLAGAKVLITAQLEEAHR